MNKQELVNLLNTGHYTLIAGNAQFYPALVPNASTKTLAECLRAVGYSPIEVVGSYDGIVETSLLVPDLGPYSARYWGKLFGQESVLYAGAVYNRLLYTNGEDQTKVISGKGYTLYTDRPADNYTQVKTDDFNDGQYIYFNLNLNF